MQAIIRKDVLALFMRSAQEAQEPRRALLNSTGADIRVVVERVEFRKNELVEISVLGPLQLQEFLAFLKCICAWISWTR